MRHLISPLDFTVEETYEVLDFADRIAANPKAYAHAADGRHCLLYTSDAADD